MGYSQSFLDPEVLAKIDGLTLRARAVVEGTITGLHRSPFHGFSVEFAEHREYSPGDDLRYVDWKVFGRTDKFYVKRFEQETNLSCHLLVDASESMRFKSTTAPMSKWEYAQCLAAGLAYIILAQQDRVGMRIFADHCRVDLRAETGGGQWQLIVEALEREQPAARTAVGAVLHETAERMKRRGLVILIGDLLADVAELERGLKHLRYARHEAIVFHVLDPLELTFELPRPVVLKGLESVMRVAVDPRLLREAYRQCIGDFLTQVQRLCHSLQIDYVRVTTNQRIDHVLREYLSFRQRVKYL